MTAEAREQLLDYIANPATRSSLHAYVRRRGLGDSADDLVQTVLCDALAVEAVPEVALDSGRPDAFPAAEAAAVDPVEVLLENPLAEGFAGALAGQDAGKTLAEGPHAVPALELVSFQQQHAAPQSPVFVPHTALVAPLAAEPCPAAMRTRLRLGAPR